MGHAGNMGHVDFAYFCDNYSDIKGPGTRPHLLNAYKVTQIEICYISLLSIRYLHSLEAFVN